MIFFMRIILLSLIKYSSTTDNEVCMPRRLFNKSKHTHVPVVQLASDCVLTSPLRCSRWQSNEHTDQPLQKQQTPATITHIRLVFSPHLHHLHSKKILKCISHLYLLAISVFKTDPFRQLHGILVGRWMKVSRFRVRALAPVQQLMRVIRENTDERHGERERTAAHEHFWVLKPTDTPTWPLWRHALSMSSNFWILSCFLVMTF